MYVYFKILCVYDNLTGKVGFIILKKYVHDLFNGISVLNFLENNLS